MGLMGSMLLLLVTANVQAEQTIKPDSTIKNSTLIAGSVIPAAHSTVKTLAAVSDTSDTLSGWKFKWRGSLHGSQASYNNWSSGGVDAVSATASTLFNGLYRKEKWGYALMVDLRYGRSHLDNEGSRKTDDRIRVKNKFTRRFKDERWNAFIDINLETQFDQGYDYDVPDTVSPKLISGFFSPAYISQIAGIGFTPTDYFTAGVGLQLKETIVSNDSLSTQYGLSAGDNFRLEPGFSIQLAVDKNLLKNVELQSSIETFTNIQRAVKHTDFSFSNLFIGKINKYLNVTFEFDTVYNDHFSKQLQVKEVLSAGLSVALI